MLHLLQQTDYSSINLVGFAFVLGLTKDMEIQNRIESEKATYGDILQIDMFDDYYNLTLKVVGLMNWMNNNCSPLDFMLKVDDDVYVNVQNLLIVLKTVNASEQSMYGSVSVGLPNRYGKWYISYEDWPWSNYPVYFRGAAVLMPGSIISSLLAASQTTPYFPFDDTYLTGLCSSKAGVKVRICDRFFVGGAPEIPEPCHVYTSITWLTDSAEHLNRSHWATEDFYKNVTQCVVKQPDGVNQTVDPAKSHDFSFST
ncbi:hypothetical protein GHT06_012237 [Daphnia sinensis]|uniref:Hexosyltransferase n=1 Tax=Daphnia sinensis TaxID=1820382 RepID=A0AAD5LEJ4_9CRUS|nr:hypothetical protein GHT06_012237 [Daphnia sinensis]